MHPADLRWWLASAALTWLSLTAHGATTSAPATRALVWLAEGVPTGPDWARELGSLLERAGWAVDYTDSSGLTNRERLATGLERLLVLPGASRLPVESIGPIEAYLRRGGDLMAFGLPAWGSPTFRRGDRWLTQAEYEAELNRTRPARLLLGFATDERESVGRVTSAGLAGWARHTNRGATPASRAVVREEGQEALHVTVGGLDGWDTLEPVGRSWTVPAGETLTCFRAKGGPRTRQLALEWIEQDGSRWIATVDLTTQWRNYGLPPEAFRPWQPPAGRGGSGDRLNLAKVVRFTLGLALTHTAVEPGAQEYWFADLGTTANPFGDGLTPSAAEVPHLLSLAPGYECYPVTTPVSIRPPRWQAWVREETEAARARFETNGMGVPAMAGEPLLALHPRPRGVGFRQDREVRWQPLLVARDATNDDYRGAVGALLLHSAGRHAGGRWAAFTPGTPAFYRQPEVAHWLELLARRWRSPVHLVEGGSEFFTVFPDQAVPLGARVTNRGSTARTNLQVLITLVDRRTGKPPHRVQQTLALAPGETRVVETSWSPTAWPESGATVMVQLLEDGGVVDELHHELNRWTPPPAPDFVTVREGGFSRSNRLWRPHGVNYMPSSGVGIDSAYFEYWLGRGAYDPEVIERDLRRVKGMGLNAVSAFIYHRDLGAQHLLDFLFRCARLDLKVNLSLRPGTPMDFRWEEMKALIEHYRLAQNDTVFAYDLAWEPSHYDERYQRQHYAEAWDRWVQQRYGSRVQAQAAWDDSQTGPAQAGSADGRVALPTMAQLTRDGAWRRRAVDYRRFLDDLLAGKYAEARRLVRSIDPHHLVSFRMQHAGDPTYNGEGMLPYDFVGLREAVDIWEPEAYGRIGDWERVKAGHFTAAYARLCDPAKPVMWTEMGYDVGDPRRREADPVRLELAARFYRDFYRMLRESRADGVFFWWYPGGYRLNERSDFGLLNADGTDRPVTQVMRELAPAWLAEPLPGRSTRMITVDRDADARGLFGIYETVQAEYWSEVDRGGRPGLSWRHLPGEAR